MVNKSRTTIGLKKSTKSKLDVNRAPGQCYDGFLCQMVELWEASSQNGRNANPRSSSSQPYDAVSKL
jgi:hypothetical protein